MPAEEGSLPNSFSCRSSSVVVRNNPVRYRILVWRSERTRCLSLVRFYVSQRDPACLPVLPCQWVSAPSSPRDSASATPLHELELRRESLRDLHDHGINASRELSSRFFFVFFSLLSFCYCFAVLFFHHRPQKGPQLGSLGHGRVKKLSFVLAGQVVPARLPGAQRRS